MALVQEGPPPVQGASGPPNADLLFKEAKQRERRRRLAWFGVVAIVVGGVVASVAAISSPSKPSAPPASVSLSNRPKATGLPLGSIVPLEKAGPLAVGPNGGALRVRPDTSRGSRPPEPWPLPGRGRKRPRGFLW